MARPRAAALIAVLVASSASPFVHSADNRFSGGDGSSCDKPVVLNIHSSSEAARAEMEWFQNKYGGGRRLSQSLVKDPGKWLDAIEWETPSKEKVSACFDVTKVYEEFARRMQGRK